MISDNLKETLSAWMDDEAEELEVRRLLGHANQDDILQHFSRHHLVRSILQRETCVFGVNMVERVSMALEIEPVVKNTPNTNTPNKAPSSWLSRRLMAQTAVAASVASVMLMGFNYYPEAASDLVAQFNIADQNDDQFQDGNDAMGQADVSASLPLAQPTALQGLDGRPKSTLVGYSPSTAIGLLKPSQVDQRLWDVKQSPSAGQDANWMRERYPIYLRQHAQQGSPDFMDSDQAPVRAASFKQN